jgi:hypothetical protein
MITLSITEANVFKALGDFLTSVLPAGTKVVRGQQNRVPEPPDVDHVVMWPITKTRLATNVDDYTDIAFRGSISGTLLEVTDVIQGVVAVGLYLDAHNMSQGTHITGQNSSTEFVVAPSQTLISSVIQAGTKDHMQSTQILIQVDVHGPASGDNAQRISTLLRDEYATESFSSSGFDISPLYSNDARQIPFTNGEQQLEEKWTIEVVLQANPIVSVPQQFFDTATVTLEDVS